MQFLNISMTQVKQGIQFGLMLILSFGVYKFASISLTVEDEILSGTNDMLVSIKRYERVCGNPKINIVIPKRDGHGFSIHDQREWSLKSNQFFQFLGFDNYIPSNSSKESLEAVKSHKPICRRAEDRVASSSMIYTDRPCTINWLSVVGICQIFQKFSNVMWIGDSLTRGTYLAVHMLLSQNLRYGSISTAFRPITDKDVLRDCNCDGLFSESILCRTQHLTIEAYAFALDGYCPYTETTKPVLLSYDDHYSNAQIAPSCNDDSRLKMVYIQGGLHYKNNATLWFQAQIQPTLNHIVNMNSKCSFKTVQYRIILLGPPIVATNVGLKYEHQKSLPVIEFYRDLKIILKSSYPQLYDKMVMVDFLNVTKEAQMSGRSSDGVHLLTDTNFIKAMTIINLMGAMAEESQYNIQPL